MHKLTVATFRSWRGWACIACTGPDVTYLATQSDSKQVYGAMWHRVPPRAEESSGAERDRTADPHVANVVLSQLSYCPVSEL
jgi:formate-dependent nitrite reductase cytochrome c552 subunit